MHNQVVNMMICLSPF